MRRKLKYRGLKSAEKEIIDSKIKSDNKVARIHVLNNYSLT